MEAQWGRGRVFTLRVDVALIVLILCVILSMLLGNVWVGLAVFFMFWAFGGLAIPKVTVLCIEY
jgi:hypothetical protein